MVKVKVRSKGRHWVKYKGARRERTSCHVKESGKKNSVDPPVYLNVLQNELCSSLGSAPLFHQISWKSVQLNILHYSNMNLCYITNTKAMVYLHTYFSICKIFMQLSINISTNIIYWTCSHAVNLHSQVEVYKESKKIESQQNVAQMILNFRVSPCLPVEMTSV